MGTVVITGAATGIGRRAAVALVRAGRHVVVVTRSEARAAGVLGEARAVGRSGARITSVPADLAELGQVRAAVEQIAELGAVRAVINNAAILAVARRRPQRTADGIEEVFAVNHVAPFVLATGLRPHFADDGRVITAGSKGLTALPWLRLDPDDLDSSRRWSPIRAYYRSKMAQLAFTAELIRRGVAAAALRVPSVRLDEERLAMYPPLLRLGYRPKQRLAADPEDVAARYVALAAADPPTTGHVDEHGRAVGWPNRTGDPELAQWLWDRTAQMTR